MKFVFKKKFWIIFTALTVLSLLALGYFSSTAGARANFPQVALVIPFRHPLSTSSLSIFTQKIEEKYPQVDFSILVIEEIDGGIESVVTTLKKNSPDLIVTLGAAVTQKINSKIIDIPTVFFFVTDPVLSGLTTHVESNQRDVESGDVTLLGGGGSGAPKVSNLTGIASQVEKSVLFDFFHKIMPFESVGVLYGSSTLGDAAYLNSYRFERIQEYLQSRGILVLGVEINHLDEIPKATRALASRVDGFYLGTGVTIERELATYGSVTKEVKKPLVTSVPTNAITVGKDFVLGSGGINYNKEAVRAAVVAIRILGGEAPSEIPVSLPPMEDTDLYLNVDVAENLGIEVSDSVKEEATIIYEKGILTRR